MINPKRAAQAQGSSKLSDNNSSQPPKEKKKGLYIGPVNLKRLEKRLLFIVNKDSIHGLRAVNEGPLDKNTGEKIRAYLKFVKELNRENEKREEDISDRELEKVARESD